MGNDQERPSPKESSRGETQEFLLTLGKAILTLILGLVALTALAATVCGMVLTIGGANGGAAVVIGSAILLAALVYAIIWLWR
jgi:hypothetical protein